MTDELKKQLTRILKFVLGIRLDDDSQYEAVVDVIEEFITTNFIPKSTLNKVLEKMKKKYRFTKKGFEPDTYQMELDGNYNQAIDDVLSHLKQELSIKEGNE